MLPIWTAVSTFFSGFSLKAWLIIGGVLAFAVWTGGVYHAGKANCDAKWEVAMLEAKIKKMEMEKWVEAQAEATEDELQRKLEIETTEQQKKIDDYANELKNRPDKCLLGPDAGRLQ